MLQQQTPTDYVISTGRQESVRKFIELAALEFNVLNALAAATAALSVDIVKL